MKAKLLNSRLFAVSVWLGVLAIWEGAALSISAGPTPLWPEWVSVLLGLAPLLKHFFSSPHAD
ncbi:hypothetical protein [Lactiplantibacillus carotarum]|uniref:hypothetical protein n=1 Tax=Lactiplantibacillus carotarum TaxID=2993456 RepID=UPI00298F136B|nr:hypothetical protein [Lactiplantibacillus carotarum]